MSGLFIPDFLSTFANQCKRLHKKLKTENIQ